MQDKVPQIKVECSLEDNKHDSTIWYLKMCVLYVLSGVAVAAGPDAAASLLLYCSTL